MKRFLLYLFIALPGAMALRSYVAEGVYVATASMEPTLPVGRRLILDKLTYRWRTPRRGEVVVFPSPVEPDKDLLKRVIAVGGDTIEIRQKVVFLNGAEVREPYVEYLRPKELLDGDDLGPLKVPPGTLFVMGDNRDESGDSRDWKDGQGKPEYFIPVSAVKGKVLLLR